MNAKFMATASIMLSMAVATAALAQRGVGEPSGIARQAVRPELSVVSGTLKAIEIGPCQQTTGRYPIGTHLVLTTKDGAQINVHVGPAAVAKSLTDQLAIGEEIRVDAFRTDKMAENHFIAKAVHFNGKTVELRDASLRPNWARGGRGFGQWPMQANRSSGRRGGGRGYGNRWGNRW
jgi:hypothetical protein